MMKRRKRTLTATIKTLSELLDCNELSPREQIKYQQMIADGDLMVSHWKRNEIGWDLKVPQVPQRMLTVRQVDPSMPGKLSGQASSR
jgi:hypothetical protein